MISSQVVFWVTFIALFILFGFLDRRFDMLRDKRSETAPKPKPYSLSLVQLAWWTMIIVSSYVTITLLTGFMPTITSSTLILMGITAGTTAVAKLTDLSDISNQPHRHQDEGGKNLFIDILSDENGISISRLQTVLFNIVFGLWFIRQVLVGINSPTGNISGALPEIDPANLVLLGISAAAYAGMKTTENKNPNNLKAADK
jgi:hypothetical protein